jgi:hypothetical protein
MEATATTSIDLRTILNVAQGAHYDEWVRIPGGFPGDNLLTAFLDVSSSQDPPALAAFHHWYRATYVPDARIGLAWGMADEEALERRNDQEDNAPDWKPSNWRSVEPRYVHILLNGSLVWQVCYGSVNWGAGVDGEVPWPQPGHPRNGGKPTYWTTRWEAELVRLINDLQENTDFRFDDELAATGMQVRDFHPLDVLDR